MPGLSWIAVPAALLLAGCDGGPTRPSSARESSPIPRIVALGDSLTSTSSALRADQAYPAVLQRRLSAEGYRHEVVNAGVSGDTTAGSLTRLDQALIGDVQILIVALGGNDGLRGVPVPVIENNLAAIIERAQQRGVSILLCAMETFPTNGFRYFLDFRNIFPALAERYDVPLVPFILAGVVGDLDMTFDGIHPNAAGSRRIAENIWPYLRDLLALPATQPVTR